MVKITIVILSTEERLCYLSAGATRSKGIPTYPLEIVVGRRLLDEIVKLQKEYMPDGPGVTTSFIEKDFKP